MAVYLSNVYRQLPLEERRRQQRLLRTILSVDMERPMIRQQIRSSYLNLGSVAEVLRSRGLEASFQRLLRSFCMLEGRRVSSQERASLQRNPYTIWFDRERCLLSGEAMELLQEQSYLPDEDDEDYLLMALAKLNAAESKAWSRWLGLDEAMPSLKERRVRLYWELVRGRCLAKDEGQRAFAALSKRFPFPLEDIFPNNPHISPMAWFYRGILPLYHCLREIESNRVEMEKDGCRANLARLFKAGYVTARPAPPVVGEQLRWLVYPTWEGRQRQAAADPLHSLPEALFMQFAVGQPQLLF